MPFYRITVTDINGKISQGIKEDPISDIETYYNKARQQAIIALKSKFKTIEVVMLTSDNTAVLEYQNRKRNSVSNSSSYLPSTGGKEKFAYRNMNDKQKNEP